MSWLQFNVNVKAVCAHQGSKSVNHLGVFVFQVSVVNSG